jgi:hypothetical protein
VAFSARTVFYPERRVSLIAISIQKLENGYLEKLCRGGPSGMMQAIVTPPVVTEI